MFYKSDKIKDIKNLAKIVKSIIIGIKSALISMMKAGM